MSYLLYFNPIIILIDQLCMIDNPISIIAMENYCNCFMNLTHLNISGSKLNSWIELESLNCLKKLKSLKLKGIPLLQVESIEFIITFELYNTIIRIYYI